MVRHSETLKQEIVSLRRQGYMYAEIQKIIGQPIPKGTLTYICRGITLNAEQSQRIREHMRAQLAHNRVKAIAANRRMFEKRLAGYHDANQHLSVLMRGRDSKLIALAMLYLGEGAKWSGHRGLQLGSANPKILRLYISLLHACYGIRRDQLKCRVQQRADQDSSDLLAYWSQVTGVSSDNFYPMYVDKRTEGQRTTKEEYRGVCVISCAGTHIQLELEQIAGIIFEAV